MLTVVTLADRVQNYPRYTTPSPYGGSEAVGETYVDAKAAIVEGGALEIRRYEPESFDYDVVAGYAPGAWKTFTNTDGQEQADG